jgi:hypothetical protein
MKAQKKIPRFKSEKEEFEFWSTHESTEYVDYLKGKKAVFPNLKLFCRVAPHTGRNPTYCRSK